MNDRIKELAEQVGFGPAWFEESQPGYPALPKEGMLKEFAELIVRECAKIVNSMEQYEGQGDSSTAEYIKEHFGIE